MAESSDSQTKEIEEKLKQLLRMSTDVSKPKQIPEEIKPVGVVFTKEDFPSVSETRSEKPNSDQRKRGRKKHKKGSGGENEANNNALGGAGRGPHTSKQHQPDPDAPNKPAPDTGQLGPKKKKKKKPRKRNKDKFIGVSKEPISGTDDSDSEDEEAAPTQPLLNKVISPVKYLDDKLTHAILNELEKERIFPLKKKSSKFVNAKYFCRLCDYHCDSIAISRQHATDARHQRRKEIMMQDRKLKQLPEPSERHIAALDALIMDINTKYGATEEEFVLRQKAVEDIQSHLKEALPDISLRMYGSSLSGFALKTSDINIDLVLPDAMNLASGLIAVFKHLKEKGKYQAVQSDFQAKVPCVMFKTPCDSFSCQITVGSSLAFYTSQYLALYTAIDPRVKPLAVAFRYWAKVCQVDNQESGSLPAYTFGLMAVYFLQQCDTPVVPVLWKDISEEALKGPKTSAVILDMLNELKQKTWTSQNQHSVGRLWRELLLFFGVYFDLTEYIVCIRTLAPLKRSEKKWKSKRIAVEDPFSTKRNVARSLQNPRIFDYFYNCLRKACLYFGLPTSHPELFNYYKCKKKTSLRAKQTEKGSLQDTSRNEVIKDDQSKGTSSKEKDVEPPEEISDGKEKSENIDQDFSSSTEVSSDASIRIHKLLENSMMSDCTSSEEKEKINEVSVDTENDASEDVCDSEAMTGNILEQSSCVSEDLSDLNSTADQSMKDTPDNQLPCELSSDVTDQSTESNEKSEEVPFLVDSQQNGAEQEQTVPDDSDKAKDDGQKGLVHSETESDTESDCEDEESSPDIEKKQRVSSPLGAAYEYEFSVSSLTDGKGPSIFCQICEKEGHLKVNCPEDQLPDLKALPAPTKQHLQLLTGVIKKVPKDFRLSQQEIDDRESIRGDLQYYIQDTFRDAELCLFGSSMNGFGFHHSDLDICVTFRERNQEDINFVDVIEAICKKLKTHRGLYNVFPITTAKVPIVKFKHRNSQLEGDISLYNILAQQNTRLLYTYGRIDPRVQTLGYAIKVFAKVCDIGDASKGSLSSYAYMLMMFHYLQHTRPPVIPVLQELQKDVTPNPVHMIDGWNAWFYDDLKNLPQVWDGYGKNSQSVGELWLGFFRYYLEEFSLLDQVITIKQFETLSKFEKLWNGKCIAIEDPFDLNHNLGGGLSRKMNQYIQRTFIHARMLYGRPITRTPDGYKTIEDYFFDKEELTEGEPPSDRLCRVCSKIGHIAKECPKVLARKEREAIEKKRKEERLAQEEKMGNSPNKSRDRPGSTKSGSPSRARGQPMYQRQHSDQYPDQHQIRPVMEINTAGYHPHQNMGQMGTAQAYGREHRSHSHSPGTFNHAMQGHNPRGYRFQGDNSGPPQFYRGNQNDNSHRRYNQHAPNHPDYHGNPGQRGHSNQYRDSPNMNQAYMRSQSNDGCQQVPVNLNNSFTTAAQVSQVSLQAAATNTTFVPTTSVYPSSAYYVSNNSNSMVSNIMFYPSTSPLNGNMADSYGPVPVCAQGWFPTASQVPAHIQMPGQPSLAGNQRTVTIQGDRGAPDRGRLINVQNGSRQFSDMGVTIKNDYYRGKDN